MVKRIVFVVLIMVAAAAIAALPLPTNSGAAQNPDRCAALVRSAMEDLERHCDGTERNRACYGFIRVEAQFVEDAAPAEFMRPGDEAELLTMESLHTLPMDLEADQWGVVLMNVQANLPQMLPEDQQVVFVLLGDVEVENGVNPDDAVELSNVVPVTTLNRTNLYAQPSIGAHIAATVESGVALEADALSIDGEWLRVVVDGTPGWLSRRTVSEADELDALVMLDRESFTPMQSFYYRTRQESPVCLEAENMLLVQAPDDVPVDITANGVAIRVESTIALRLVPDYTGVSPSGLNMELTTLSGEAMVYPDQPDAFTVQEGEAVTAPMSELRDLGIDGETDDREVIKLWSRPRALSREELAEFQVAELVPEAVLDYGIDVPEVDVEVAMVPTVTVTPTSSPTPAATATPCAVNTSWMEIYVVQSGDTLTSIAAIVDLTAQEVATANCIANPDLIVPGQEIRLPFIPAPPTPVPPPTATPIPPPTATPIPTATPSACAPTVPAGDVAALIAAINLANDELACPGADTIWLSGGTYTLTAVNNTVPGMGDNGLPVISTALTIRGQGATIQRDGAAPDFRIFFVDSAGDLTLRNVTISGGRANFGGGIYNDGGALTVYGTVSGNNAVTAGGGIAIDGSSSLVLYGQVNGNISTGEGGGIYHSGSTVTINGGTVSGNTSSLEGGAIVQDNGTLTATDATFQNNSSVGGGMIYIYFDWATFTNTTISGNTPDDCGGPGVINDGGGNDFGAGCGW